eukprot:1189534-Prorocentrum_minimum.AAC.7
MATLLSEFPARLPSANAAMFFPSASPVRSSCTSSFTAPAHTMATLLSKFIARRLSAVAA